MKDCLFCKIIRKEIPANMVYEDDKTIAFKDIHPKAPIHFLVIPKEHLDDFYNAKDNGLYIAVIDTIKKLIEKYDLMKKGYKIEVNGGGAQIVDHLHFHLLAPISYKN